MILSKPEFFSCHGHVGMREFTRTCSSIIHVTNSSVSSTPLRSISYTEMRALHLASSTSHPSPCWFRQCILTLSLIITFVVPTRKVSLDDPSYSTFHLIHSPSQAHIHSSTKRPRRFRVPLEDMQPLAFILSDGKHRCLLPGSSATFSRARASLEPFTCAELRPSKKVDGFDYPKLAENNPTVPVLDVGPHPHTKRSTHLEKFQELAQLERSAPVFVEHSEAADPQTMEFHGGRLDRQGCVVGPACRKDSGAVVAAERPIKQAFALRAGNRGLDTFVPGNNRKQSRSSERRPWYTQLIIVRCGFGYRSIPLRKYICMRAYPR